MRRVACAALAVMAAIAGAALVRVHAQTVRDVTGPAFWQGTSAISGSVVDAATDAPVRRAIVTVQGAMGQARSVVTDDEGRFHVGALPAGRYDVVARKVAYLDATYGASRPGRPGTPVRLDDGESVALTVPMSRGAVFEGTVRDESGAPMPDVDVYALDPARLPALGRIQGNPLVLTAKTDDRGVYRIFGVPPGEYVIGAHFALAAGIGLGIGGDVGRRSAAGVDAMLAQLAGRTRAPGTVATPSPASRNAPAVSLTPIYYPGTPVFSAAMRLVVEPGDEHPGLDIVMRPVPSAIIEGAVAGAAPLSNIEISLNPDGPHVVTFGGESLPVLDRAPGPDGSFRYTSVPPGRHTIYARSRPRRPNAPGASAGSTPADRQGVEQFALATVDVTAGDARGVTLVLRPGVRVSGSVIFDGAEAEPPDDPSVVRIELRAPDAGYVTNQADGTVLGNILTRPRPATVRDDWTFEFSNVAPGTFDLTSRLEAGVGWWLRSALAGGRDLLDAPFEVGIRDITDIVMTWTDRPGGITGVFQTSTGQPLSDFYVVVFPADENMWIPGSRRVASTRPGTDGRFTISPLPSGAYRLIALADFELSDFDDRQYLQSLVPQSIVVTVGDGEVTEQDIRVAE